MMGSNPSVFKGVVLAAEHISWYQAVEYCNRLSERKGLTPAYEIDMMNVKWNKEANGYRLPTEAEWEYAARAGVESLGYVYAGRDSLDLVAWFEENSSAEMHPIGTAQSNELSIYDMTGNVREWCWDWYGEYPTGTMTDPTGPSSGSGRVARGGSWRTFEGEGLRVAFRSGYSPDLTDNETGFRVAARAPE